MWGACVRGDRCWQHRFFLSLNLFKKIPTCHARSDMHFFQEFLINTRI